MSTSLTPHAPSLYEIEQDLQDLLDTEDLVSDEQRQEFEAQLQQAIKASIDKRERVANFLAHCSLSAQNCDAEIRRLQARKKTFENAEKRLRHYVQAVIESLPTRADGRPAKLEARTATFSLRSKPPSVEVLDEASVPSDYKNITVTMPLDAWEKLCAEMCANDNPLSTFLVNAWESGQVDVSKSKIKVAIDNGVDVPGCDLNVSGHYLVVK